MNTERAQVADDIRYFNDIVAPQAQVVASYFGLSLNKIALKRFGMPQSDGIVLGYCKPATKEIYVLLRPYVRGHGFLERMPDKKIMFTLAHELAHLRYADHSDNHSNFTDEIFNFIWYRKAA